MEPAASISSVNGEFLLKLFNLNYEDFLKTAMELSRGLKKYWAMKIRSAFEAIKSLKLNLKHGAWVELCGSPAIPLLASTMKRSSAAIEGLDEGDFVHFKSCLKALNLLFELTGIFEELECSFAPEKRKMKIVVNALTVLTFKEGTAKTTRQHPTSNLEAALKTFEQIKQEVPGFKPKEQSIITHYRLRGDLRACSDGLEVHPLRYLLKK